MRKAISNTVKVLAAALLLASAPVAGAQAGTREVQAVAQKPVYVVVTGDAVRGRSGPGTNYSDTGARFNKGDRLKVFSQRNGWYEVRWGQDTVWITGQYATVTSNTTPTWVMVSVEGPVRLRLGPGGKDSGLRVDLEETFPYLGESGNWYKVKYKGKVYWISKDCSYAE